MTGKSHTYEVATVTVFLAFIGVSLAAGFRLSWSGSESRGVCCEAKSPEAVLDRKAVLISDLMDRCLTLPQEPESQCRHRARRFADMVWPNSAEETR